MNRETKRKLLDLILGAIIAALYVVLTVPAANFSYGMIQFRLAEALTVLPALTPAAIPAVFLGCLIANLLNPMNLGLIDIIGGSLCTLVAAYLTYLSGKKWRDERNTTPNFKGNLGDEIVMLLPPVLVNAFIVGGYLPFLLYEGEVTLPIVFVTMGSILLSQMIVIYAIGLPFLRAIARTPFLRPRGQK